MRHLRLTLGVCACCMGVFCLTLSVQAEMYVAGQVGASIPNKFSNVEGVDSSAGLTISDLSLQNSLMYGAKLGYYFDSIKWLGGRDRGLQFNPASQATGCDRQFWGSVCHWKFPRSICSCAQLGADQHRGSSPNGWI